MRPVIGSAAAAGFTLQRPGHVRAPPAAGFCAACSFNEVVPDLADPQRRALWIETEAQSAG